MYNTDITRNSAAINNSYLDFMQISNSHIDISIIKILCLAILGQLTNNQPKNKSRLFNLFVRTPG